MDMFTFGGLWSQGCPPPSSGARNGASSPIVWTPGCRVGTASPMSSLSSTPVSPLVMSPAPVCQVASSVGSLSWYGHSALRSVWAPPQLARSLFLQVSVGSPSAGTVSLPSGLCAVPLNWHGHSALRSVCSSLSWHGQSDLSSVCSPSQLARSLALRYVCSSHQLARSLCRQFSAFIKNTFVSIEFQKSIHRANYLFFFIIFLDFFNNCNNKVITQPNFISRDSCCIFFYFSIKIILNFINPLSMCKIIFV